MILLAVLLVVCAGGEAVPFRLVLLSTEGGINPGEERITLAEDGSVTVRRWRLAQGSPLEERWAVAPDVVAGIRGALDDAQFDALPEILNEAHGTGVAFSTTIEVIRNGKRHTVTSYRHGTPPTPEAFLALATNIRDLIFAARPSPSTP